MSGASNAAGAGQASGGGALGVVVPFVIVTLIWGSTWLVIRDQLAAVPPSWSVTYRFAAGSIAMAAYALATRTSLALPRPVWGITLLLGLAQFVVNFNLVYRAEAHITSGLVAVIFALLVIPNALLGRIFLGQQLSRGFIAGSAVALAGIALLFAHEWGAGVPPARAPGLASRCRCSPCCRHRRRTSCRRCRASSRPRWSA
ncbi:DMT family transporter [Sphingomonas changnyeongensis]|uniref:DMT family transporter n=1 Tax=Sphingomonas changnyeongensis TaxID=2698679 RepID=UPI002E18E14E